VSAQDIEALARWSPNAAPSVEIAFTPSRVLMQDFTGVPAIVDLAAMRDAIAEMGGHEAKINPLVPVELVIDHSVQVDAFGTRDAFRVNVERELERNRERYAFLRWAQDAFGNLAVVPPGTGICHQVNLEYLARVVFSDESTGQAYPDTLVGTDSHTTMVNGLGVLGWGVGGIEAEAAMLGRPTSMLIPQVLGVKLHGELREGATATDLVLTVTQMLRERGVVGIFVEFFGEGLKGLPVADRATIGNMSPEFGCTCAIFPVDAETLRYLEFTGRPRERIELVEAYCREQGLWHDEHSLEPVFSDRVELDLGEVVPSLAGPRRPQDRVALSDARAAFRRALAEHVADGDGLVDAHDEAEAESFPASDPPANGFPGAEPLREARASGGQAAGASSPEHAVPRAARVPGEGAGSAVVLEGERVELTHGDVVIAAITSCTNTSNPSVMIGAGLLARNAVARGLHRKPWVKTSLAPGSRVVTDYLDRAGLTASLEELGFNLVGYGCTTCIGNSGPLPDAVSKAVDERDLAVVSVLSGNRNFEGRINPEVKMNYLASPPLCVAYALAGTMDIDITKDPLGQDGGGQDVYLRDIWPSEHEVAQTIEQAIRSDMFRRSYAEVFTGDEDWQSLASSDGGASSRSSTAAGPDTSTSGGGRFPWDPDSTYVRQPPYFQGMPRTPVPLAEVSDARVLALLGDSVTTDHISPAGAIKRDGPAGLYLQQQGVAVRDFNSYGSRRGNHEVMVRGTFANIRLRNLIGGGPPLPEGGITRYFGAGSADRHAEQLPIYDAAVRYAGEGIPLLVIAGREYGSGSSRDWAAKGTSLLGVKAVIAQSFERIHRANLVGMGVLPLQFAEGQSAQSLGLTGEEVISLSGIAGALLDGGGEPRSVHAKAERRRSESADEGSDSPGAVNEPIEFDLLVRIDTPREAEYFRHGGILQNVLRRLLSP
jgi:aconitate hydratase